MYYLFVDAAMLPKRIPVGISYISNGDCYIQNPCPSVAGHTASSAEVVLCCARARAGTEPDIIPAPLAVLANSRQELSAGLGQERLRADLGGHDDLSGVVGHDFADDRGVGGVRAFAERFEDGRRFGFRREDDETSLAGEVKRLEAEHPADAADFGRDGDVGGIELDSDLALVCDFIQDGADAAARGVAGKAVKTKDSCFPFLTFP